MYLPQVKPKNNYNKTANENDKNKIKRKQIEVGIKYYDYK